MAESLNPQQFVITDGDEGVQINEGIRLGFAGAGYGLDGFVEAVRLLKKVLPKDIRITASAESAWVKQKLNLEDWEQVDAMAQQHTQVLADQNDLLYAGFLPFADPQDIDHEIKGHMVRPRGMHLANKICFTFGGGEQTYNLGQYLISADWVAEADKALVKKVITPQVEFYQSLGSAPLKFVYQTKGVLSEKIALKNKAKIEQLGYKLEVVDKR